VTEAQRISRNNWIKTILLNGD